MELTPEVKAKIDSADYATLLAAWRHLPFEPGGVFEGESGRYFAARMSSLRAAPGGQEAHVAASKAVGWTPRDMASWQAALAPRILQNTTDPDLREYMNELLRFIAANKTADTIGSMLVVFDANGVCHYGSTIDPSTAPKALRELADRLESDRTVTRL